MIRFCSGGHFVDPEFMILNRQRQVRVSVAGLEKFLARAGRALRLPPRSFTVCLVTNSEIARWNRAYRGKPRPTDVLSFPSEESNGASRPKSKKTLKKTLPAPYIGDIAIAPGVARRNAERFGRTFDDEMRILMLHGMLHLMGYDHETDTGQMDRRERRLRRQLGLM
jgi:probable rRNA maturation factor